MMDWAVVLGQLANMGAPILGGLVGGAVAGPAGAALGSTAGKLIAEKLGVEPTPQAVQEVINRDPNVAAAAAQAVAAENGHELEALRAALADTQNARAQTIALASEGSNIAWAAPVISTIIVGGFFACVVLLFYVDRTWDERTANLMNTLFGVLAAGFIQVCNYWLGSSAGSKRAGDAVRSIAEGKKA